MPASRSAAALGKRRRRRTPRPKHIQSQKRLTWYLDFLCRSTFSTSIEKRWPAARSETQAGGNAPSSTASQAGAWYSQIRLMGIIVLMAGFLGRREPRRFAHTCRGMQVLSPFHIASTSVNQPSKSRGPRAPAGTSAAAAIPVEVLWAIWRAEGALVVRQSCGLPMMGCCTCLVWAAWDRQAPPMAGQRKGRKTNAGRARATLAARAVQAITCAIAPYKCVFRAPLLAWRAVKCSVSAPPPWALYQPSVRLWVRLGACW